MGERDAMICLQIEKSTLLLTQLWTLFFSQLYRKFLLYLLLAISFFLLSSSNSIEKTFLRQVWTLFNQSLQVCRQIRLIIIQALVQAVSVHSEIS